MSRSVRRPRHKYGAIKTKIGDRTYDSRAEARYALYLDHLKDIGVVVGWLPQIPFTLPGKIVYKADFLIFYADGETKLVDVKGVSTPEFKLKQKLMAECYPWMPLIIVPAKDVPK